MLERDRKICAVNLWTMSMRRGENVRDLSHLVWHLRIFFFICSHRTIMWYLKNCIVFRLLHNLLKKSLRLVSWRWYSFWLDHSSWSIVWALSHLDKLAGWFCCLIKNIGGETFLLIWCILAFSSISVLDLFFGGTFGSSLFFHRDDCSQ